MDLKDALIAARKLIEKPECWTRVLYCYLSSEGMRYCAVGACRKVSGACYSAPLGSNRLDNRMAAALKMACGEGMVTFNDSHTHAEVLAVFDKAIAEAGQIENLKPKVRP